MKKFFYWLRLILWCALIFYFSSVPDLKTEFGVWDFVLRKLAHAFVYGALYIFARPVFFDEEYDKRGYLLPLVFSIMYAISDEYHQGFVPGRHLSPFDVGIDTVGILIAMYAESRGIMNKIFGRFSIISSEKYPLIFIIFFSCFGCAKYEISRLEKLESRGKFVDAAVGFERFMIKNPSHPLAPYALFKAAQIYNYRLKLPSKSASLYRKAEQDFSDKPDLVERARQGLLRSPDYMPLADGARWVEGDSSSGGSNMKATWTAKEISTGSFIVEKKFTAGGENGRLVAAKKLYYFFKGYTLIENSSPDTSGGKTFLEYPIYDGKKWKTVDPFSGETIDMRVEFVPGAVEVRAGRFTECIRVAEKPSGSNVTKYNYYAPYVGWILTTVAGSQGEHRNSELVSYNIYGESKDKKIANSK